MNRALGTLVIALCGAGFCVLAQAQNAIRGQQLYATRCAGCHSVDADRIGPHHAGVFGRRAGGVVGYAYSPALAKSRLIWNASNLERWLKDPEALIPGQKMGYTVSEPRDRADLVAYLAALK